MVAAGLVVLYGRVGMISLGQIALLAIGTWTATRLSFGIDLPFPVLLLVTGAITCVIGVLIGLPALRLSGLYLALITLMAAGAVNVVLTAIDFPNGGGGFTGRTTAVDLSGLEPVTQAAPAPGGDIAYYRYTRRRLRADVPARARALREQARARVGRDPRERAGGARGGREHHALQALGVRARVVHDGRRRLPAGGAGRRSRPSTASRRRTR